MLSTRYPKQLISESRFAVATNAFTMNRAMSGRMDELDEIRCRMRLSHLEARIALREIEAAALTREINSPLTSGTRRTELIQNEIPYSPKFPSSRLSWTNYESRFPLGLCIEARPLSSCLAPISGLTESA